MMGVAGCGKSSLARVLAQHHGYAWIEGDDFHSEANLAKMSQGVALTDEDRSDWLSQLSHELQRHSDDVVLTCSALKKSYRDRLRQSDPSLKFIFLKIDKAQALRRVIARSTTHFFHADLVDNQFATLESPIGESQVLELDATQPLETLREQAANWLQASM